MSMYLVYLSLSVSKSSVLTRLPSDNNTTQKVRVYRPTWNFAVLF